MQNTEMLGFNENNALMLLPLTRETAVSPLAGVNNHKLVFNCATGSLRSLCLHVAPLRADQTWPGLNSEKHAQFVCFLSKIYLSNMIKKGNKGLSFSLFLHCLVSPHTSPVSACTQISLSFFL